MQKRMQRLFSVLFALVLTMALVTIAAGAENVATEVSTVEQLKEAAVNGGNIKLTADLTVDEIIVIQKDLTIDGNGHKITGTAMKTFEVGSVANSSFPKNVTFKNITLENTSNVANGGRSIDTRVGGLTLTLDNTHVIATGTVNTQPLTISGDTGDLGAITVNIQNKSSIKSGIAGYSIIMFNPVNLNIKDSAIEGVYAALYFKPASGSNTKGSAYSVINVENSTLSSENSHDGISNAFGTIVFEDGDITVNVDKQSTVSATNTGDQPQYVLLFKEATGITVNVKGQLIGDNLIGGNKAGNKITVPADYVDEMVAQGDVVTQNADTGALYVTLAEALADAKAGATIKLLKDITLDEITIIEKDVTIDGNNHTITGTAKKTFEVGVPRMQFPKNVTFKNVELINTSTMQYGGRSINTRVGGVTLTLDNVDILAPNAPNAQALLIGGDAGEQGALTVNILNGSTIDAGASGYSFITYNPVNLTIKDSTVHGLYTALYFKAADGSLGSAGSVVNVVNSTLSSKNSFSGESNSFGTVVFEDNNITLNVDSSSSVSAQSTSDQLQAILSMKNCTGIKATIASKISTETFVTNYVVGSTILVPADYADTLTAQGLITTADGDMVYVYPAHTHKLTHHDAVAPDPCKKDGNIEYWTCDICSHYFADADALKEITVKDTIAATTTHKWTTFEAKTPTCTEHGNLKYYVCEHCGEIQAELESGRETVADLASTIVGATGHDTTKVPFVEPTYTATGNIEYYICTCGKLFKDVAGATEIKLADTILPQLIKIEESKAEVSVDAVDKALDDAIADSTTSDTGKPVEVVIDLTEIVEDETVESTKVVEAVLPVTSLEKVAEKNATLTLNMSNVTVTMDSKTLETISQKAEGTAVTLKVEEVKTETLTEEQKAVIKDLDVATTISASIICEATTEEIHDFNGGSVTVQLPFSPADGTSGNDYAIWYIADDGSVEKIETTYVDGHLVFSLAHFSEYVVVNTKNSSTESETEAPTEAETEAPTEAETEAPTEAETEAPTEAETEAPTETETEAPTETETEASTETETEASTETETPSEPEDPETGDSRNATLMITVMTLAFVTMTGTLINKKKVAR